MAGWILAAGNDDRRNAPVVDATGAHWLQCAKTEHSRQSSQDLLEVRLEVSTGGAGARGGSRRARRARSSRGARGLGERGRGHGKGGKNSSGVLHFGWSCWWWSGLYKRMGAVWGLWPSGRCGFLYRERDRGWGSADGSKTIPTRHHRSDCLVLSRPCCAPDVVTDAPKEARITGCMRLHARPTASLSRCIMTRKDGGITTGARISPLV